MKAFNDRTRADAIARGIVLVDLEPKIDKDLDHFVDDVHYTPKGARRIAEEVAATIGQAGLIVRLPEEERSHDGPPERTADRTGP